jgi:hypothetical protein
VRLWGAPYRSAFRIGVRPSGRVIALFDHRYERALTWLWVAKSSLENRCCRAGSSDALFDDAWVPRYLLASLGDHRLDQADHRHIGVDATNVVSQELKRAAGIADERA